MLSQVLANTLIAASYYVLAGIGFGMVYATAGFFNLSLAAIIVIAPYTALFLGSQLGIPLWLSFPLGLASGVCAGCLLELFLYRRFRRRRASHLVEFLASLGVYVFLQNLISFAFGDAAYRLLSDVPWQTLYLAGAVLTTPQVILILVTVACYVPLEAILRVTALGKRVRAVANDSYLATVCGINRDSVVLLSVAIASLLGSAGGIIRAIDVDMTPRMGLDILLMAIVAAIVGGITNLKGILVGAVFLAITQQLAAWFIGDAWKTPIAFFLLVVFLLLRPTGVRDRLASPVSE